jgi:hypothetical protein
MKKSFSFMFFTSFMTFMSFFWWVSNVPRN